MVRQFYGKAYPAIHNGKLTSFRAVVELGTSDILAIKDTKVLIQDTGAVTSMEKSLDHFNETRNAIYAAGETGNYPIDGQDGLIKLLTLLIRYLPFLLQ